MTIGQSQRRIRLFIKPILSNADKGNRFFPENRKAIITDSPPDPGDPQYSSDAVHSNVELQGDSLKRDACHKTENQKTDVLSATYKEDSKPCRKCDSQLASFHRKMARILRVTKTKEKAPLASGSILCTT